MRAATTGSPAADRLLNAQRDRAPRIGEAIEAARGSEILRYEDLSLTRFNGGTLIVDVVGNLYYVGSQPVIGELASTLFTRKTK